MSAEKTRVMRSAACFKKVVVNLCRVDENMKLEMKEAHVLGKSPDRVWCIFRDYGSDFTDMKGRRGREAPHSQGGVRLTSVFSTA